MDETLAHFRTLAEGVPVPVNGDFRGGFATEPEEVGAKVALAVRGSVHLIGAEPGAGGEGHVHSGELP